ncbi:MAG: damage-inducible protein DinB [Pirellula sp.]|nr:damage-inducible protein DinB [Pirellula sp.]
MDLLDRLLGHDAWTTRQLLDICASLPDEKLDAEFDIGFRTLRATLTHIIHNTEVWTALMAQQEVPRETDRTVPGLICRLEAATAQIQTVARAVADRGDWDEKWLDYLDNPPVEKTYGAAIAHVITHSMHHRAQVLYLLRLAGVANLPEGDVFSWENRGEAVV